MLSATIQQNVGSAENVDERNKGQGIPCPYTYTVATYGGNSYILIGRIEII